jgi:hypothetical protein
MKGNNPNNERVMVHVRMRPFNEDETKNYNSTPIENFDTKNGVIVGRLLCLKFFIISKLFRKNIKHIFL